MELALGLFLTVKLEIWGEITGGKNLTLIRQISNFLGALMQQAQGCTGGSAQIGQAGLSGKT